MNSWLRWIVCLGVALWAHSTVLLGGQGGSSATKTASKPNEPNQALKVLIHALSKYDPAAQCDFAKRWQPWLEKGYMRVKAVKPEPKRDE